MDLIGRSLFGLGPISLSIVGENQFICPKVQLLMAHSIGLSWKLWKMVLWTFQGAGHKDYSDSGLFVNQYIIDQSFEPKNHNS